MPINNQLTLIVGCGLPLREAFKSKTLLRRLSGGRAWPAGASGEPTMVRTLARPRGIWPGPISLEPD